MSGFVFFGGLGAKMWPMGYALACRARMGPNGVSCICRRSNSAPDTLVASQ